jgi:DNA replicative helicase MCM subunit Mcm2 (Cdc46/Mcm family)
MNKEKKLYGQLLTLGMEKEEVLKIVEKFYSEWKTEKDFIDLGQEVLNYMKKEQINLDFVPIQRIIDNLINVEQPLCTPKEFEETINSLVLRGKIYQPRKDYYKVVRAFNG